MLLVPAAFTTVTGQAHWEILLRARAIETQCYVRKIYHHSFLALIRTSILIILVFSQIFLLIVVNKSFLSLQWPNFDHVQDEINPSLYKWTNFSRLALWAK